jgi:hypothetical protein
LSKPEGSANWKSIAKLRPPGKPFERSTTRAREDQIKNLPNGQLQILMVDSREGTKYSHLLVRRDPAWELSGQLMQLNGGTRISVSVPANTKIYVVWTQHQKDQTPAPRQSEDSTVSSKQPQSRRARPEQAGLPFAVECHDIFWLPGVSPG